MKMTTSIPQLCAIILRRSIYIEILLLVRHQKEPKLPTLDQKAITAYCSSHPLPFEVFEDPFFQWTFNTANTNRQKVADRRIEIADEWRKEMKESSRNTFVTVVRPFLEK